MQSLLLPAQLFEAVVPTSAKLVGSFSDWPANIQDGIYAAIDRQIAAQYPRRTFRILVARGDTDEDGHFCHVIVEVEAKRVEQHSC